MPTIPFYYLTLESYYLGILVQPAFTGPDDISLIYIAFCFLNGYYGNGMWVQEYDFIGLGKLKFGHLLLYIMCPIELISILIGVGLNLWHARKNENFKKMYAGKKSFISHISYMIVVCSVFLGYAMIENNQTTKLYPKLLMTAYGSHFLQGTLRAMISGVTLEVFNPFRRSNILMWILMICNGVSIQIHGVPLIDEFLMICLVNIVGWSCVFH